MASSMTISGFRVSGHHVRTFGTGNLGTYSTNGIAVTANQVGLGVIDDLLILPAGGYVFAYDKTNGKVKAFDNKDPGAAGGADIAFPEVGSVDISAAVFRWEAFGV